MMVDGFLSSLISSALSQRKYIASPKASPLTMAFDSKLNESLHETHWLVQISQLLETNNLQTALQTPTSIFKVVDSISSDKPEAYFPHRVALGPYHHFRNELYRMELYKLENALKARETFQLPELNQMVDELERLDIRIRSCFDKFLGIGSEALARIMLVDGLFLVQLLAIPNYDEDDIRRVRPDLCFPSPFPMFVEQQLYRHLIEGNLMTQDEFVRDILLLENQIPLLVLKTLLPVDYSNNLHILFFKFCDVVSPKKLPPHDMPELICCSGYTDASEILEQSHHLLHFLYLLTLDSRSTMDSAVAGMGLFSTSFLMNLLNILASILQIAFLQQISEAVGLIQSLFGLVGKVKSSSAPDEANELPLIPSATELKRVGVKLNGCYDDFHESISFKQEPTVRLKLPTITINAFAEVVFRNLMAFEAATKPNHPYFSYYATLMSGLITTTKDVKMLKQARIIERHSGSEGEIVKLFDGLRNLLKLHQQSVPDSCRMNMTEIQIVKDINLYYESCWGVKAERFMKRYMNPVLKVLLILVLIFLMAVVVEHTVCDWFGCSKILYVNSGAAKS